MHLFQYGQKEIDHLIRRDTKLGRAIGRIGMIERQVVPDLFEALVHSVVSQQISRAAADTVWGRLCRRLGKVTPRHVAGTDVSAKDTPRADRLHPCTCGLCRPNSHL